VCRAVVFLKKLSVYRENKDAMRECGITDKLAALVPCKNEVGHPLFRLQLPRNPKETFVAKVKSSWRS
jgi:hypothetical protein